MKFVWEPFNHTYGPWFQLRALGKDGVSVALTHAGRRAEAVVQPDMNRQRWYWSVRFAAYRPRPSKPGKPKKIPLPERKIGGRAKTMKEACTMAQQAFKTGRPTGLTVVK